jgi:transposase InsO family protein
MDDPAAERLRQEMHRVCAEFWFYGYRRVTKELRRRGLCVGRKRVRSLMRKENLRCRPKKRWIRTTDSRHGYRVYPNLAQEIIVQHPNQLWVADITYIRLVHEFVYLAVILDAFSRRAIGWALGHHVDTRLSLAALEMALHTRTIEPGLVHHSDRGVQYASTEYVALLESKNITISMSRKGNPYDNAKAESFMKTLKTEEVSINEYESFSEATEHIGHFIDVVYNQKRLHSALGYITPVEFEAFTESSNNRNNSTLTTRKTVSL